MRESATMLRYRQLMLLVTFVAAFVATLSGQLLPVAAAAESIVNQASPYQVTGTIDAVDLTNNTLLIDDRGFQLTDNVVIHAGNRTATKLALRKGAKVGFNITNIGGVDQRTLNEIWLISGR
jgi:hypothetical protein